MNCRCPLSCLPLLVVLMPATAQDDPAAWKEITAVDGRCVLKAPPANRTVRQTTNLTINGIPLAWSAQDYIGPLGDFGLATVELPANWRKRFTSPTQLLNALCQELLKDWSAQTLKDERITYAKKHAGRQLVFTDKDDGETVHLRIYCIEDYVIAMLVSAPAGQDVSKEIERFYASFRWLDKKDLKSAAKAPPLPKNLDEATPEQLAQQLGALSPAEGGNLSKQLLERLEAGKGAEYTRALAEVLPKLKGPLQQDARSALARRLERMTVKTLTDYFEEENAELRLAAIRAAGAKNKPELIPDLIRVMEAGQSEAARAAHEALEVITKQKLALPANPNAQDWKRLAERWREAKP